MFCQEYRDETGKTIMISHGDTASQKAKSFLHEKIINSLPADRKLIKKENQWELIYTGTKQQDHSDLEEKEIVSLNEQYADIEKQDDNTYKVRNKE